MIFLRSIFKALIFLLLIADVVYGLPWQSKEEVLLLALPDKSAIFQKVNDESEEPLYSILGWDGPYVCVSDIEEDHLEPFDTKENTYHLGRIPSLTPFNDSILVVSMEPFSFDMARAMGRHTDNIVTHDCLFRMVLSREFYYSPPKTRRLILDFKESAVLALNNQSNWQTFRKGVVLSNPYSVRVEKNPKEYRNNRRQARYNYAYYDSKSRQIYLIERLSKQEIEWNLYFFPSILVGYSILDNPLFTPILTNETGCIYKIAEPLSFSAEQYVYLGKEGLFARIVGNQEAKMDEIAPPIKDYFINTDQMNQMIRSDYESDIN